jgi:hypothetical protein
MNLTAEVSFASQPETGIPTIVPQGHDAHSIQLLIEKQVVRKSVELRAPPTARIEVKPFRVSLDTTTGVFELCPEIISQ